MHPLHSFQSHELRNLGASILNEISSAIWFPLLVRGHNGPRVDCAISAVQWQLISETWCYCPRIIYRHCIAPAGRLPLLAGQRISLPFTISPRSVMTRNVPPAVVPMFNRLRFSICALHCNIWTKAGLMRVCQMSRATGQ